MNTVLSSKKANVQTVLRTSQVYVPLLNSLHVGYSEGTVNGTGVDTGCGRPRWDRECQ